MRLPNNKNAGLFRKTSIATLITMLCQGYAVGQENQGTDEETVERIEVSSTKRSMYVTEVAKSITVLGEEDLEVTGAISLADVGFAIPNTVIDNPDNGTRTNVRIRGIGDVGVYIDDVVLGQNTDYAAGLLDVARVEVLRGPQGTLFGKNTTGGVINTITRKPDGESFFMVDQTVGSYGLMQTRLTAGGGFTDDLAAKISLITKSTDGYSTDVTSGKEFNGQDYSGGRLQFYWDAGDSLDVQLSFDYFENDTTGGASELVAFNSFTPDIVRAAVGDNIDPFDHRIDISDNDINGNPFNNFDASVNWGAYLRFDYETSNDFTLTSISSYREGERDAQQDPDFINIDFADRVDDDESWQISQEVRLVSPEYDNYSWIAGLYYYKDDSETIADIRLSSIGSQAFGLPPLPAFAPDTDNTKREDQAIFGNLSVDVSDDITAELGLRYSKEKQKRSSSSLRFGPALDAVSQSIQGGIIAEIDAIVRSQVPPGTPEDVIAGLVAEQAAIQIPELFGVIYSSIGLDGLLGEVLSIDPFLSQPNNFTGELENESLSVSASVVWNVSEDSSIYAAFSDAERQGGFNTGFGNEGLPEELVTFDSETVSNFELGFRGLLADLDYSFSIFQMQYDDIQLTRQVANPNAAAGVSFIVDNAGEAEINGAEFTLRGDVSNSINLFADIGYMDTDITSLADGVDPSLLGNELGFSPEWTGSIGLTYGIDLGDNGLISFTPQFQYRSESWLSNQNLFRAPETTLVNLNVNWQSADKHWNITARALNLTDDIYYTNVNLSTFFSSMIAASISAPERYSLEVRYTF